MDLKLQLRRARAKLQTLNSPKIDLVELARLCLKYWRPEDAVTMIAICGAESGYRIRAMNVDKRHGKADYGLFQINEDHKPDMTRIYDPEYNISIAHRLWDESRRWIEHQRRQGVDVSKRSPFNRWMAYRDRETTESKRRSWQVFLNQARQAVSEARNAPRQTTLP